MQKNIRFLLTLLAFTSLVLCGCVRKADTVTLEEISLTETDTTEVSDDSGADIDRDIPLVSTIVVHVCGAVANEDVYDLDEGSRVIDAVNAAGGLLDDADTSNVNLASLISDGTRIRIPFEGEEVLSPDDASAGALAAPDDGRVNINTATEAELKALQGIGDKRAADIVSYRQRNGVFGTIEDIMKVPGIKQGLFEKIKELITV